VYIVLRVVLYVNVVCVPPLEFSFCFESEIFPDGVAEAGIECAKKSFDIHVKIRRNFMGCLWLVVVEWLGSWGCGVMCYYSVHLYFVYLTPGPDTYIRLLDTLV